MSRECCGPEDTPAAAEVDDCCAPGATATGSHDHDAPSPWWRDPALLVPAASGVLLLAGYAIEWSGGAHLASTVVFAVGLVAGASTFVPGAVRRLLRGKVGVGLLMTIAAVGAVALGHVGEAAALAFLFSIAEALEDRAMDRARHGLRALLSLIPETARISRLAGESIVPAADVRTLDILVVGAGERVATDGVVVRGRSSVDTSAVTGESIPVEVGPGDPVLAGAVNGSASLHIEATADGRDNSLTTIVRLVEEAHASKGERARLADRIARPLVPAVLVAAALVAVYGLVVDEPTLWLERALVVLVAASPCALAIAVPVTVISAIGAASRLGVIIKSGVAFEQLGTIRTVALDKTGTLTRNQPEVVAVETAPGHDRASVLAVAAGLESTSTHPLAAAITAAVTDPTAVDDIEEHAGRGVSGSLAGRTVRAGSPQWIPAGPLAAAVDRMAQQGMSIIMVEQDGEAAGAIGIRDELRPEAAEAVRELRELGVEVAMLTGDNARTAQALAERVGIREVHAAQLPQDKAEWVRTAAASTPTAMIGDGINDAPALAAATVGIAMGATGSAAAVESASVAFTGTDLRLIPRALAHARRGRRIMTGNIGLALAIIVVLFPLALFGVLGLAGVVLVHEVAEVVVILNGVRAARHRRARPGPTPRRERAAAGPVASEQRAPVEPEPLTDQRRENDEPQGGDGAVREQQGVGQPPWCGNHAAVEVVQGHVGEQHDHDDPDDHAVRAERADAVEALEEQPVHEADAEQRAGLQREPPPAGQSGTREHGDAGGGHDGKRDQADQRVREAEHLGLVGRHDRATGQDRVDRATRHVRRVLQQRDLLDREDEGREGTDQPAQRQHPADQPVAQPGTALVGNLWAGVPAGQCLAHGASASSMAAFIRSPRLSAGAWAAEMHPSATGENTAHALLSRPRTPEDSL